MQCITPYEAKSWVYVTNDIAKDLSIKDICAEVRKRVFQCNAWLCDLDGTHAASPGKLIAKKAIGTGHYSLYYLGWCARTAYGLLTKEPGLEGKRWKSYVDSFLRDSKALEKVVSMFDERMVQESLYPGVEDFCRMMEYARKFYVTRNIWEVASAYSRFLRFDGFYPEAESKAAVVEESFVRDRPHLRFYGVEGDSEEDAEMVSVLGFHGKDVLGILYSDEPIKCLDGTPFDMNVSKDRTGLVKILSE